MPEIWARVPHAKQQVLGIRVGERGWFLVGSQVPPPSPPDSGCVTVERYN